MHVHANDNTSFFLRSFDLSFLGLFAILAFLSFWFSLVRVSADFPCFGNGELAMMFLPIAHMDIGSWLA